MDKIQKIREDLHAALITLGTKMPIVIRTSGTDQDVTNKLFRGRSDKERPEDYRQDFVVSLIDDGRLTLHVGMKVSTEGLKFRVRTDIQRPVDEKGNVLYSNPEDPTKLPRLYVSNWYKYHWYGIDEGLFDLVVPMDQVWLYHSFLDEGKAYVSTRCLSTYFTYLYNTLLYSTESISKHRADGTLGEALNIFMVLSYGSDISRTMYLESTLYTQPHFDVTLSQYKYLTINELCKES